MQRSTGNVGLLARPDENTVLFNNTALVNRAARRAPIAPVAAPEGVTLCVPGAVLAPAPTAGTAQAAEAPVFVDDSGARKRLLRIVGVLLGLLSISFLGIVGVALATPSVATSVGLGDVVPFVVPGAAAPPPAKAPVAPEVQVQVQVAKPKARPAAAAPKPAPVEESPVTEAPAPAPAGDEGHHGHTHPTGDHGEHGDHTGVQTDPTGDQGQHGGQTDHSGDQTDQTSQTGDQTSQTAGQGQQDGQQAPAEAGVPALDAGAAAQ